MKNFYYFIGIVLTLLFGSFILTVVIQEQINGISLTPEDVFFFGLFLLGSAAGLTLGRK